jgi:alpha-mannosidase
MNHPLRKAFFGAFLFVMLAAAILGAKDFAVSSPSIPSTIKYLFVVEHSHLDLGFTTSPDELETFYKANIDHAISYCTISPQYEWTIESIWQLEQWIKRSSPTQINQLINLVNAGRISIAGGYANMHTGALGNEEMNRFSYPAEKLRKEWNISIETVIQNDVPGYSWDLPQVLAKSSIKYMVTGINTGFGGGTSIPMSNMPFYWVGPDGSQVLTWISFDAYVEGFTTYGLTDMATAYSKLSQKLPQLEAAGYPYDSVLVLRAFDNADTSLAMTTLALQWNQTYDNPKIVLTTPETFFHRLEQKYGNNFASYSGDWAGYWDMLSITQPQSITKNRWAHDNAITAEKIASINALMGTQTYPSENFSLIYEKMMAFDEHNTGGAPWPGLLTPEQAYTQNQILCSYADTAQNMTDSILTPGFQTLSSSIKSDHPYILVFNPLSWNRTDIVKVKLGPYADPMIPITIVDSDTSQFVDSQVDNEAKQLIFVAQNVPPFGYKRYDVIMRFPRDPDSVYVQGNVIGNQFYRVTIDQTDGHITSIYDENAERELVNPSSRFGFKFNKAIKSTKNDYLNGLYTSVPTGTCELSIGLNGPVAKSLVITRRDSPHIRTEITLYSNMKRIDIVNVMNRSLMENVSYTTGYVYYMYAFPFNLSNYQVKLEIANAFMTPIQNNLPNAAIPYFTVQHGIALSEPNYTLTMTSKETFVDYFGRIQWYTTTFNPVEPNVISDWLKKEDQAQYKGGSIGNIEQEPGESPILVQTYSITTSQTPFDPVDTAHFAWESSNPMLAVAKPQNPYGTLTSSSMSFFNVNSSNVMILDIKKADSGNGFIVRLLELSGTNTTYKLSSFLSVAQAKLTDMVENDLDNLTVEDGNVTGNIAAFETSTVRLEFVP